jgi:rubrerythrin
LSEKKIISESERNFIVELIDTSLNSITVHLSNRGIIYTHLEAKIDENGFSKFEKLLEGLHEKGYLKVVEEEYTLFCPQCDFPNVYTKYTCPMCSSTHVTQMNLIQHKFCGYVGKKPTIEPTESFSCPNCNLSLTRKKNKQNDVEEKNDYQVIGFSFECINGHRFERPLITHLCPNCGAKFNYKESKYRPIYSYELTEKALRIGETEINADEILYEIKKVFKEFNIKATEHTEVKGLSSSIHKIGLLGEKENIVLLVDVSTQGTPDELTTLLGKKMDIRNSYALMVDAKGKEETLALGQIYGIKIFDLRDRNWVNLLRDYIKEEILKKKIVVR